jgi:hypothetical protein
MGKQGLGGNGDDMRFTETASFRGDDQEVVCRCRACGDERVVSLTGDQALRLALVASR